MEIVEQRVVGFMNELEHNSSVEIDEMDFENIKDGLIRLAHACQADILQQAIKAVTALEVGGYGDEVLRDMLAEVKQTTSVEAPR